MWKYKSYPSLPSIGDMMLIISKWMWVWLTEVEEGCRAMVREVFMHLTDLLQLVIACFVGFCDKDYWERVHTRELNSRQKRKHWATSRESSLNAIVAAGKGTGGSSSTHKALPSSAPLVSKLPMYPSVNTDVMRVQGQGLFDDMQLAMELCIAWLFQLARLPLRLTGSRHPSSRKYHRLAGKQFYRKRTSKYVHVKNLRHKGASEVGNSRNTPLLEGVPTNTAGDVIKVSGYPLQVHKVVTIDGYILTMYRIPRPASSRAAFFMHGMGDSSICWVSAGVTHSPAFEAYNQGFDVWMGDSRNTPPREHVDPGVQHGLKYWKFTTNELGERDVKAMVGLIDEVKTIEMSKKTTLNKSLKGMLSGDHSSTMHGKVEQSDQVESHSQEFASSSNYRTAHEACDTTSCKVSRGKVLKNSYELSAHMGLIPGQCGEGRHQDPCGIAGNDICANSGDKLYSLCAVGHSLGCVALLIYVVSCLRKCERHLLSRLVLLAPAGFHRHRAPMALFSKNFLKPVAWLVTKLLRIPGYGVQMPAGLIRLLAFKCLHDFKRIPALGEIAHLFAHHWTRDRSPWHKAAYAGHYLSQQTPGMSMHAGLHMVQWFHTGKFEMFDYGSKWANLVHYGRATPPDIAAEYKRIDIPVDIMSGTHDGVVSKDDVLKHVEEAQKAGLKCKYWGFDHGHLDFSLCMKGEVVDALMACLSQDAK